MKNQIPVSGTSDVPIHQASVDPARGETTILFAGDGSSGGGYLGSERNEFDHLDDQGAESQAGHESAALPVYPDVPSKGAAPLPRSGSARLEGIARRVEVRQQSIFQFGRQIVSLRLERYDRQGNRLTPVPVELTTFYLRGQITDGERVTVDGRWADGTLLAKRLINESTGGTIGTAKNVKKIVLTVVAVVGTIWLLWSAFIFSSLSKAEEEHNKWVEQQDREWERAEREHEEFIEEQERKDRAFEQQFDREFEETFGESSEEFLNGDF